MLMIQKKRGGGQKKTKNLKKKTRLIYEIKKTLVTNKTTKEN